MNSILSALLDQNTNHPETKEIIKIQAIIREKLTFHAITSSQDTYLQAYGISYHNHQQFNYIGQLIHSRTTSVVAKIKRQQLQVNEDNYSNLYQKIQQREKEVIEVSAQIQAEVQQVLNNVDLPISLFKRNDRYWYSDNPKTIEVKQYIHKLHEKDRQWKRDIRQRSERIVMKRQSQQQNSLKQIQKQQQQQEKMIKQHRKLKIKEIEANGKQRQKKIKQSIEQTKKLKPLFKIIQQNYHQKFQVPSLQERKLKLQKIRQLKKSVDLTEIRQHQKKIQKIRQNHQTVTIKNQPLKVGYKSKFYESTIKSLRESPVQERTLKQLYQKKMEYGKNVKLNHPPTVSEQLVQEIDERLKLMKRKRVRVNKKKQQGTPQKENNSDDSQNQSDEQEQEIIEQKKISSEEQDEDDQDSDDQQNKQQEPKKIRGQDQDPSRQQRHQIGVSYLEYVRKLRKKDKKASQQITNLNEKGQKKTTRYKNYLKQMARTSKTIDCLNTQSLNKQLNDYKQSKNFDNSSIERKMRKVYQQAIYQQQLLKVQKGTNQQKIKKKYDIDDAVVSTIKARLALMNQ